jgi:hypothetical protein
MRAVGRHSDERKPPVLHAEGDGAMVATLERTGLDDDVVVCIRCPECFCR